MVCFSHSLRNELNRTDASRLPTGLVVSLGIPFGASILAILSLWWLISDADSAKVSKVLVFMDVLKIASVAVLAFHTQASTTEIRLRNIGSIHKSVVAKWYKGISLYMYFVAVILTIHTTLLFAPLICQQGHDRCDYLQEITNSTGVTIGITVISTMYLVAFFFGNREFEKRNKGNIAVERFAGAFIYGANIPFIIAFLVILFTLFALQIFPDFHAESHTFLAGAVAFLIYSSTAANLCVDHYARPFLTADQIARDCPVSEHR
jgi:hypothetical protein